MLAYIRWLAAFVWLPLAALWITHPRLMLEHKKTLASSAFLALVFSVPWDVWAIGSGIWSFPKDNLLGVYILNVPIEEYLFIVFLTLLVSTVTLVLRKHLGKSLLPKGVKA
jgi:lycopene cyclase domain-containing protein